MEWWDDQAEVDRYVTAAIAHDERLRREIEAEEKQEMRARVKDIVMQTRRHIRSLNLADAIEDAQAGRIELALDGKTQSALVKWGIVER